MKAGRAALIAGLWLAVVPGAAEARMRASLFLHKADALRARGPFALLSSDLKLLQAEAESAGDSLHDEQAARLAAHEPTPWCAPPKKYLGPRELIVGLHAIAPTELERMDIKQAMQAILERNYPCPRATAASR